MKYRVGSVGLLLFGSGMCALIYQTVWLRQFRLIFGASTASSAAVLAIFMAGLGFGGILLGKIADRSEHPLALYGMLELGIAIFSALTPALLWLVRATYLATGGSLSLGLTVATLLRLLLSVVVLAIPTILMGGTLPAAARAVESEDDLGRRRIGWLYGLNTLGAVTGVLLSTFLLLETFGNRYTLWLAALTNVLVALTALLMARRSPPQSAPSPQPVEKQKREASTSFVFAASAIVGFAFLLMELVWYRMLAPLLGGTTYTFGLILALALLGIGLGGVAYAIRGNREATAGAFAITCAFEALFIAIPYALGDNLALFALLARAIGGLGFIGFAIGWAAVAFIVVFPAAFVSGIQFPILISLLGRGGESVGRHTGLTYFWNTVGAIAGSIAGGFGLLPLLGATATWRAVVVLLALLSVAAMLRKVIEWRFAVALAVAVVACGLLSAKGPTAAWRHTPIGAGRADQERPTKNKLRNFVHTRRRSIVWEQDGVESAIALSKSDGLAFLVNGKSDGHAILDGGTQVIGGLLIAALHPRPKQALVIGLGTGTTAGWLGAVPGIDRVDVFEIEPAIERVAEACTDVNRNPLQNPKIKVYYGDGREMLLTTRRKYDLISSEPSNPYRAGISSLLTVEFYRAVTQRLAPGGIFCQFLQAYEIDAATLRMVYATLTKVFPNVETWETRRGDLLLVGSMTPIQYNVDALRQRFASEPFRSAIFNVWRATDLEGVLAHYVSGPGTSEYLAAGARLNTDDRTNVEYAFARTLGNSAYFQVNDLRKLSHRRHDDLPSVAGQVNVTAVDDQRLALISSEAAFPPDLSTLSPDQQVRVRAYVGFVRGDYETVVRSWVYQQKRPRTPTDLLTFAEAYADRGTDDARPYIEELRAFRPVEADAVLGRLLWRAKKPAEAAETLARAFVGYRRDPWPLQLTMARALQVAMSVAQEDPSGAAAGVLYESLRQPFAAHALNDERLLAALVIAGIADAGGCGPRTFDALQTFEPHVPWDGIYLRNRARCYATLRDPREAQAQRDYQTFIRNEPLPLSAAK